MTMEDSGNTYAQLLKEQGNFVITVQGVDWYDYNGFMVPAFLPHCCPEISPEMARQVVRISVRPFARWDQRFGKLQNGEWWYLLKKKHWALEEVKDKKKRWMIRQGRKNFSVRPLSFDEVIDKCAKVAELAAARYEIPTGIETPQVFEKRVEAARRVPGVLEYMGCFQGNTLVSFSEGYIQDNAIWLTNIRHDPAFLNKYSSYGFMDGILHYYLNEKKMDYVLDGCRSIHHRTSFQEHLMKVFAFSKEYAALNVIYSAKFKVMLNMTYPFRNLVWFLCNRWANSFLDNVGAVVRQEQIRRNCEL